MKLLPTLVPALAMLPFAALAAPATYDAELSGFAYPHPVEHFTFTSQGQPLQMAYMDVKPAKPNGQTVMLMHGKNFCGATWEQTITTLSDAGYRVVVPDQIGFCKSSKPQHYQFSFQQLAANTHALLEKLNVQKLTVMGHSMGGMLSTRYALMYPQQVEQLVLVNPIGLEDWKALGVPYPGIDAAYQGELKTDADSIRAYQRSTYYANHWKPEYDRWVNMQAGMYAGPDKQKVAWDQALTTDMVFTQPVVYEFPHLKMPTLLLIGGKDNTAIGKALAPAELKPKLGRYEELGKRTAAAIPQSTLVEFPELGHSPQIQDPAAFHQALMKWLSTPHNGA
ncbi:alpha/beta hydrolase [Chimaeribacter coloradensis]|uniref:Alpha/beta hydrolase n=2 Tax=Chimaeribacter coloradensis TaxID=2060068 RepID=A0A2N5E6H6_9GAMM|nr:alpha/beta hydrolase [Chimaeribacter coloradensis]